LLRLFELSSLDDPEMFELPVIGKLKGHNLKGKGFAPQIQAKPTMPVFSSIPSDDTSVPFVRKDVFVEYAKRMDERCCKHEDFVKEFREEQKKSVSVRIVLLNLRLFL
jgi:hypothetical protein